MDIKQIPTADLLSELITRDGVDWSEVNQGQEYNYKPPKDGYFIIAPLDAIPHTPTIKERFMEVLLGKYQEGQENAGAMLVELLNKGR